MCSTVLSVAKFKMEELFCYYLQVDMKFDNRSNCQHAVLNTLCRDVLLKFEGLGGCLASPERDMSTILLIAKPAMIETEVIQDFFKRKRIFNKLRSKCDSFSIEKCFQFTLFYCMERVEWYKLGDSLVENGFLSWKLTNLPRIGFKVHSTSSAEIYMQFSAELIKIFPFEHWLFDREDRFDDFKSGPISKNVGGRWVSCLPNLGKGRIVRIHRKIPESSPFENYSQIKSYWKNSYGYILPSEEPCIYYDVMFNNGEVMLYPFYCVLTGPPDVIQLRMNAVQLRQSLDKFLIDFERAAITIADVQLIPVKKDCRVIQRYMDVVSMPPVRSSRIRKLERYSIKEVEKEKIDSPALFETKKVYPTIPTRKRNFEQSQDSSHSQGSRKTRPGSTIVID